MSPLSCTFAYLLYLLKSICVKCQAECVVAVDDWAGASLCHICVPVNLNPSPSITGEALFFLCSHWSRKNGEHGAFFLSTRIVSFLERQAATQMKQPAKKEPTNPVSPGSVYRDPPILFIVVLWNNSLRSEQELLYFHTFSLYVTCGDWENIAHTMHTPCQNSGHFRQRASLHFQKSVILDVFVARPGDHNEEEAKKEEVEWKLSWSSLRLSFQDTDDSHSTWYAAFLSHTDLKFLRACSWLPSYDWW